MPEYPSGNLDKSGLILPGDPRFRWSPSQVNALHSYDDVDLDLDAHHHTLGNKATQAASGNHEHAPAVAWARNSGTAQGLAANSWTRLTLDFTVHLNSTYYGFDNATDEIDIKKTGLYLIIARAVFELGGGGTRYLRTRLIGGYASGGLSVQGRINDTATADSNELEQISYADLYSGMSVGVDGYSTAATNIRATYTADEYMTTQLQIIRLGNYVAAT